jgi:hypothetical protein
MSTGYYSSWEKIGNSLNAHHNGWTKKCGMHTYKGTLFANQSTDICYNMVGPCRNIPSERN